MSKPGSRRFWPSSSLGWAAAVFGIVALSAWLIFPFISMAYRDVYPVVDTWVMPAVATTLVDGAAVLGAVVLRSRHERSFLSIGMLILTTIAGLFFTLLVVGETIGGP